MLWCCYCYCSLLLLLLLLLLLPQTTTPLQQLPLWLLPLPLPLLLSVLTAIFPGKPGLVSFIAADDDGSSGDNWSCKSCKAPVNSSPPTNQHPVCFTGRMLFLLLNQQCESNTIIFSYCLAGISFWVHSRLVVPQQSPKKNLWWFLVQDF